MNCNKCLNDPSTVLRVVLSGSGCSGLSRRKTDRQIVGTGEITGELWSWSTKRYKFAIATQEQQAKNTWRDLALELTLC